MVEARLWAARSDIAATERELAALPRDASVYARDALRDKLAGQRAHLKELIPKVNGAGLTETMALRQAKDALIAGERGPTDGTAGEVRRMRREPAVRDLRSMEPDDAAAANLTDPFYQEAYLTGPAALSRGLDLPGVDRKDVEHRLMEWRNPQQFALHQDGLAFARVLDVEIAAAAKAAGLDPVREQAEGDAGAGGE